MGPYIIGFFLLKGGFMLIEILKYVGMFIIFFLVTYIIYYFFVTNIQIRSIRGKSKKKKELLRVRQMRYP